MASRQEVYERRLKEYETCRSRLDELNIRALSGDLSNEEFKEMERLHSRRLSRPVAPVYAEPKPRSKETAAPKEPRQKTEAQLRALHYGEYAGTGSPLRAYLSLYESELRCAVREGRDLSPAGSRWLRELREACAAAPGA